MIIRSFLVIYPQYLEILPRSQRLGPNPSEMTIQTVFSQLKVFIPA